jgi:hypothetical protein
MNRRIVLMKMFINDEFVMFLNPYPINFLEIGD